MRHLHGFRKLSRTASHRKALLRNMCTQLIMHERIKTTIAKAKEVRKYAAKAVAWGRKGDKNSFMQASSFLKAQEAVLKLFKELGKRYKNRFSGHTRILRLAKRRKGDGAEMCFIELVDNKLPPLRLESSAIICNPLHVYPIRPSSSSSFVSTNSTLSSVKSTINELD